MSSTINRKYIRALCAARGWRLSDLANAARVEESTLSRVINGGGYTMSTLDRLAAALGVPASDLIAERRVVVRLADDAE